MARHQADKDGLAVVGCGNITEYLNLPVIVADVQVVELIALCNRSAGRLDLLADRYRVPAGNRYTDYHGLLDRNHIHAILIAASPTANYQIALDAADARKHVFVEKPMAETSNQARVMVEAVSKAAVKFQVGFNKRFYYAYRKVSELVRDGRSE